MIKENILKTLEELRKQEKRKFSQSVDLIINLKNFDIKKDSVNLFLELPHKVRDLKICAFLNKKSNLIDTITKAEFDGYKDKKKTKNLVKSYDFFIAHISLMPSLALTFGKYLGPAGKMPSPQLGVLRGESENEIKEAIERFMKIVRIKSKEPSLKFFVAKESMGDKEIAENIETAYNVILNTLPRKKDNVKSVMIKFTMGSPLKLVI